MKLLQTTHPVSTPYPDQRKTEDIPYPNERAELHFIEWGPSTVTITWILR